MQFPIFPYATPLVLISSRSSFIFCSHNACQIHSLEDSKTFLIYPSLASTPEVSRTENLGIPSFSCPIFITSYVNGQCALLCSECCRPSGVAFSYCWLSQSWLFFDQPSGLLISFELLSVSSCAKCKSLCNLSISSFGCGFWGWSPKPYGPAELLGHPLSNSALLYNTRPTLKAHHSDSVLELFQCPHFLRPHIYHSGSTSNPRNVVHYHRCILLTWSSTFEFWTWKHLKSLNRLLYLANTRICSTQLISFWTCPTHTHQFVLIKPAILFLCPNQQRSYNFRFLFASTNKTIYLYLKISYRTDLGVTYTN